VLLDDVLASFRDTLGPLGESPPAWYALGVLCAACGLREEARTYFEAAIRAKPHYPEAHFGLGIVLAELERYEEAAAALERAKEDLSESYRVRSQLGRAYFNGNKLDEAAREFEAALDHSPDSLFVLRNLGTCLLRLNRVDDAVRVLERAIALDSGHADSHRRLALGYHRKGMDERAGDHLQRASDIDAHETGPLRSLMFLWRSRELSPRESFRLRRC
jgi:tetratricopeptide (TPR) repeat protein